VSELSPYFILRNGDEPNQAYGRLAPKQLLIQDGLGLDELWRLIRRHLRLTTSLMVAAVLVTAVGLLLTAPKYTAQATLLISPEPPEMLEMTQLIDNAGGGADYDYYKTQFELLKGRALAARVIRDLNLERNAIFNPPQSDKHGIAQLWMHPVAWASSLFRGQEPAKSQVPLEYSVSPLLIDSYLGHLKVEPKVGTRLVNVAFKLGEPVLAAQIANRHVDDFILLGLEIQSDAQRVARDFLKSQLVEISRRVQTAEASLNAYRQEKGVLSFDVDDNNKIAAQRMADLTKALTDAETRRITAESEMELVSNGAYQSLPDVVGNPAITALRPQLVALQTEYARLSIAFNPAYPKLAEVKGQLEQAKHAMEAEIEDVAESVTRKYRAAIAQEQKLSAQIELEKQRDLALNDAMLGDAVLAREVETNRDLYKNVLQRMQQMTVAEQTPLSNINVIERASPPLSPSHPKKLTDLTIAALMALLTGLGLSFLIEHMDNRLKSSEEIEKYLALPILAVAPDFEKLQGPGSILSRLGAVRVRSPRPKDPTIEDQSSGSDLLDGHRSRKGEVYRSIRTSLLFSRAGAPPKTVLFTSSVEDEGKTWTAVNTALVFAHTGARTLLIDADLRRPYCHVMLECENPSGLSEVLVGQCETSDLIHRVNGHPLFFLSAGSKVPNPAELLTSSKMRAVMISLCEQYDFLLIDSAPLMYASDTIGMARMVEGTVLVIGANTPKQSVKRACDRLTRVGSTVLGVVLNRINILHSDYYEHSRDYFAYDNYYAAEDAENTDVTPHVLPQT
jgi:succinoglycan biosynthesis transport protein ExoP